MTQFMGVRKPSIVLIFDGTSMNVAGYGELVLDMKQLGGGNKKLTFTTVALLLGVACNLLSAQRAR